jgi:hypothetical protein
MVPNYDFTETYVVVKHRKIFYLIMILVKNLIYYHFRIFNSTFDIQLIHFNKDVKLTFVSFEQREVRLLMFLCRRMAFIAKREESLKHNLKCFFLLILLGDHDFENKSWL